MYSSNPLDYPKYPAPPMPTVPPQASLYGHPSTTGFPVSSANQFYPSNGPATFQVQSQAPVAWSTGLCDCGADIGNCCITCWCPCITFGQIAELVDRGSTSCATSGALYALILCVTGCSCLYSCFYRSKIRGQYFLHEKPCADCLVHCCCESCALCQEYRELKSRGFDMSIGWQGNLDRQSRGITEAPMMQGGMTR